MTQPTQEQLEHAYKMQRLQLLQQFGRYISYCFIAFFLFRYSYLSVQSLAGKTTITDLLVSLYAKMTAPKALALVISWLLTGSTASWGYAERKAKQKAIERLHPLAVAAQTKLDPKRDRSGITRKGNTKPEDK